VAHAEEKGELVSPFSFGFLAADILGLREGQSSALDRLLFRLLGKMAAFVSPLEGIAL
jgi:hypothetical protein